MRMLGKALLALLISTATTASATESNYINECQNEEAISFCYSVNKEKGFLTFKVIYNSRAGVIHAGDSRYGIFSGFDSVKAYIEFDGEMISGRFEDYYELAQISSGTRGQNPTGSVTLTNDPDSVYYSDAMPSAIEVSESGVEGEFEVAFAVMQRGQQDWVWYSNWGVNFDFPVLVN